MEAIWKKWPEVKKICRDKKIIIFGRSEDWIHKTLPLLPHEASYIVDSNPGYTGQTAAGLEIKHPEGEFQKEDKEKRERIEKKNNADSLCFSTEKLLKDLGDKVDKKKKEEIEKKVEELKKLIEKDDFNQDEVAKKSEELSKEVQELSTKLYQEAAKEASKKEEKKKGKDKGKKKEEKVEEGEVVK